MIKNIISLLMIIFIILFFYLVIFEYLSDKNKKLINLNRLKINEQVSEQMTNLPILKNDTNNVIEFNSGYNENNIRKPKRNFWELFKK